MGFSGFGYGESGSSATAKFQATLSDAKTNAVVGEKDNSDSVFNYYPFDVSYLDEYSQDRSKTFREFPELDAGHFLQISTMNELRYGFELLTIPEVEAFAISYVNQDAVHDDFEDVTDNDQHSIERSVWTRRNGYDGLTNIWTMFDDKLPFEDGFTFIAIPGVDTFISHTVNQDHAHNDHEDVTDNDQHSIERSVWTRRNGYDGLTNIWTMFDNMLPTEGGVPQLSMPDLEAFMFNYGNQDHAHNDLEDITNSKTYNSDRTKNLRVGQADSVNDILALFSESYLSTPLLPLNIPQYEGISLYSINKPIGEFSDITDDDQDSIEGNIWLSKFGHDAFFDFSANKIDFAETLNLRLLDDANFGGNVFFTGFDKEIEYGLLAEDGMYSNAVFSIIDSAATPPTPMFKPSLNAIQGSLGTLVDLITPMGREHRQTGHSGGDLGLCWTEAPYERFDHAWLARMDSVYHYDYLNTAGEWVPLSGAGDYDTPYNELTPYSTAGKPADVMKMRKQENILAVEPDINQAGYATPDFSPVYRFFTRGVDIDGSQSDWQLIEPQFADSTVAISGSGFAKKKYINKKEQPYLVYV